MAPLGSLTYLGRNSECALLTLCMASFNIHTLLRGGQVVITRILHSKKQKHKDVRNVLKVTTSQYLTPSVSNSRIHTFNHEATSSPKWEQTTLVFM